MVSRASVRRWMSAIAQPAAWSAAQPHEGTPFVRSRRELVALRAAEALPAPLVIGLGFSSGGYPRGVTAVAAVIVAMLLTLRCLLAPRTVRRPGRLALGAGAALLALAAWQLASAAWSISPWRAFGEADRTILYLLALATFATLPRRRLQPVLAWTAAGIAVLAVAGLATRLRPDLFPIEPTAFSQRLGYPLSYWNAVAALAAFGLVACLHLAADADTRPPLRVLAAALFPALATTLYLTLSRGGIAAACVGLAVYALLGATRLLPLALASVAAPAAVAVAYAYDATALVGADPTGPAAVAQGQALQPKLILCCVVAGAVRALLLPLDARLTRRELRWPGGRVRLAVAGVVACAAVAVAFAAGVPGMVERGSDRLDGGDGSGRVEGRDRLTSTYDSQRLEHWRVALDSSRDQRLEGVGAGTYGLQWFRHRDSDFLTTEAHSLYVETLSELGVAGLACLLVAIGMLLAAPIARWRRRPAAAAVLAIGVAWALHCAIDWDWEMPAVTLVPLVLCASAACVVPRPSAGRRRMTPWVVGFGALALAALPAMAALGQARLDEALTAYDDGRCPAATVAAQGVGSLEPMRPEPHAVLAACALRRDDPAEARRQVGKAVAADPENWEWRYLDALIAGASGRDPRPALNAARRFNPQGVQVTAQAAIYRETPRALWPLRSVQAFVWIGGRAYPALRL